MQMASRETRSAVALPRPAVPGGIETGRGLFRRECGGSPGPYRVRFAQCDEDLEALYRLRFLIFNLELNEGLESAYNNGLDRDAFDEVCDHLIVEHHSSGNIIGTYRLQTGTVAAKNLGFYGEREFDFGPYEHLRSSLVELGRACIHREHRSFEVLTALWRGVVRYALDHNARFLIGCSSLNSQSPQEGSNMYWGLQKFLVEPALRTRPQPNCRIPVDPVSPAGLKVDPPRLLRGYLSVGAQICGEPALDREFKTIDFLTFLDLNNLPSAMRTRLMIE